jgi:YD repeat-containing protein
MKKILLLLSVFTFNISFGQVDNYDILSKNIESSNIHSITKFRESKKFPNGEKKFKLEFNQQGQLISIEEYEYPMGPDNPMVMKQEIDYNGEGVKVATHINAPGGSTAVDTLIYNDNGDLTQKQRIVNGQVVRTWDYTNKKKDENKKEFDDNGKLLKLIEPNGDYTTYEYDSNGNLTKELQFQEGKEHTKYTFEYDKDNILTKIKTYLLYIGDGTTAPLNYYFDYKKNE